MGGGQSLGTAVLDLRTDSRHFDRGVDGAERKAGGLGNTLKSVGAIAGGFLAANVIAGGFQRFSGFVGGSVEQAVRLGESANAVNKIFGDSAQTILDWGKANATSFGLSDQAFREMAVPLGAMLGNSGIAMDEVADKTITLTQRAADMASVFNTDVGEALTAIQAGLRGESDPLERYGVRLNAAAVEARALADTGKDVASALTEEDKALARVNLLLEQTASSAGDFADTSGELANASRIQAAQQEELQAQIGQHLIPVMLAWNKLKLELVRTIATKVVPALATFAGWVGKIVDVVKALVSGDSWRTFEPLAAMGLDAKQIIAVSDVLMRLRDGLVDMAGTFRNDVVPVVITFWRTVGENVLPVLLRLGRWLVDNRPVLIGVGVALAALVAPWALIAAGALLVISRWDDLTERFPIIGRGVDLVREQFARLVSWIDSDLVPAWKNIRIAVETSVGAVVGFVRANWSHIEKIVRPVMEQTLNVIETTLGIIRETFAIVMDLIQGDWSGAWENLKDLVRVIMEGIRETIENLTNIYKGILSAAWAAIKVGAEAAWNEIKASLANAWGQIERLAGDTWDGITGGVSDLWSDIKGFFTRGKDDAIGIWTDLKDSIFDTLDELQRGMLRPFEWVRDRIGGIMRSLGNNLLSPLRTVMRGIESVANGLGKAFNWVADKLGVGTRIGTWNAPSIPYLARGTDNFGGGLAMVGEGGPELVRLPRGAGVTPAAKTAEILAAIKSGIAIGGPFDKALGAAKGAWGAVTGAASAIGSTVIDFAKEWIAKGARALFEAALRAIGFSMPSVPGVFSELTGAAFNKLKDGAIDYVAGLLKGAEELLVANLIKPLTSYVVTQRYGRTGFSSIYSSGLHSGIDLSAATGTAVMAAGHGSVTAAGWSGGYGNAIDIAHGALMTRYAHLSSILVRLGQAVSQGQTIGRVGSTGFSTGPHLHFEVFQNGRRINPDTLLNFGRGGIVPGPLGAPRLARVHGGEEVLTARQRGGVANTFYITAPDPESAGRYVEDALIRLRSKGVISRTVLRS